MKFKIRNTKEPQIKNLEAHLTKKENARLKTEINELHMKTKSQSQRRNRGDDEQLYSSKASISRMGSSCKPQSLSSDISKEQEIINKIKKQDNNLKRYAIECELKGFQEGRKQSFQKVLDLINKQRENGNVEDDFHNGFSPALCLSDIIKLIEKDYNEK